jgi:hypothetical protein
LVKFLGSLVRFLSSKDLRALRKSKHNSKAKPSEQIIVDKDSLPIANNLASVEALFYDEVTSGNTAEEKDHTSSESAQVKLLDSKEFRTLRQSRRKRKLKPRGVRNLTVDARKTVLAELQDTETLARANTYVEAFEGADILSAADSVEHTADKKPPVGDQIETQFPTVGIILGSVATSVRLQNCLARQSGFFTEWDVNRAVVERDAFKAALMRCSNIGNKTVREVIQIIDQYLEQQWPIAGYDFDETEPKEIDPIDQFDENILETSIVDVISAVDISTRLRNLLKRPDIIGIKIRDFLKNPESVRAEILAAKNSGRKTTAEAIEIISAYLERIRCASDESAVLNSEDILNSIAKLDPQASTHAELAVEPPIPSSPRERIEQVLASLPTNEKQVLTARYGLDGSAPQTLQEIAARVHVTRQRVNQVEAKALRRLRTASTNRAPFSAMLDQDLDNAWSILTAGANVLDDSRLSETKRLLDPVFMLAVDVVHESFMAWISKVACCTDMGWVRTQAEAEQLSRSNSLILKLLKQYATPTPLTTLRDVSGTDVAPFTQTRQNGFEIFEDYLCSGYLGAKAKRTVRMHSIALRSAESGLFDVGWLSKKYRQEFPEDNVASRLFRLQAEENPHLFALLFDNIWLRLPYQTQVIGGLRAPPFEYDDTGDGSFIDGSIGSTLIKYIEDDGPQRMVDLRARVLAAMGDDVSAASISAILASNPCFRRVAPGIFGLYRGNAELSTERLPLLLDERQCRSYCFARYGGAPSNYFPAWGARFEQELAQWAKANAPTELYRSLLAVIEPQSWPTSEATTAYWIKLRSIEGRWEIGAERRIKLGHRFIDAEQFFSVLAHLVVFGWTSWFAVNRTAGSKTDNHDSADVLALLVMAGLVEPTQDWQSKHEATEFARSIFNQACVERHLSGKLSWSSGVLGSLLSSLRQQRSVETRGWVQAAEFNQAVDAWMSGELGTGKAFERSSTAPIDVDDLFDSQEWNSAFGI